MFFLIRVTFWLGVVFVLLPTGGSKYAQQTSAPGSELRTIEAISAASATVSDMRQFCARQPEACAVGSQAAVALGQRAQAGAKMVYEFLNDRMAAQDNGSATVKTSANRSAASPEAGVSQNTLTPADRTPAWRGSPPHKDANNKHSA